MVDLRGKVVVLTGASSRIGRAAALQFAARGCVLVLSGRHRDDLEEVARACRDASTAVLVVLADVTREADVQSVADMAVHRFGHVDVWINNAGVSLFTPLFEGSFELHRRALETSLYGAILGARTILPIFRKQGHGTLINVASNLRKVEQASVPSYAIGRSALHGLSQALRVELADAPNIHVCMLLPYAIAFPMAHAPSPEDVAQAMVSLTERPRRVRHVPRTAALGILLHTLVPNVTERLLRLLGAWHDRHAEAPS